MFLSLIPAWLACCLFFGTSQRQTLLKKTLPIISSQVIAVILLGIMLLQLFMHLPTVSALITGFALICCFLPLITLISAYKKYYLVLASFLVCALSIVLFVFEGGS